MKTVTITVKFSEDMTEGEMSIVKNTTGYKTNWIILHYVINILLSGINSEVKNSISLSTKEKISLITSTLTFLQWMKQDAESVLTELHEPPSYPPFPLGGTLT